MSYSILSLINFKSKEVETKVETSSIRTVDASNNNAGDVNVLGIVAVHTPVRIWAVDKEILALEEKLADRREELLYLKKIEAISMEYKSLRESRQRARNNSTSSPVELGI